MTSVGYIATFHMAAPTQAAVFMKILLILARSLPSAGGCVAAWAVFCASDTGSGEGQLLRRHFQGVGVGLLSSSSAGTSVYKPYLEPGLLTGGAAGWGSGPLCGHFSHS